MTVWRHIGSIGAMLKPGAGGWSLQIQGKAMSGKFFAGLIGGLPATTL